MIGFKLPSLGADMDDGTLLAWKVAPGQAVHKGDVVAVVDTTKAAIDVECWEEGRVHQLLTQPGEKISVGTVMAWLLAPGEEAPAAPAAAPLPAGATQAAAVQAPAPGAAPQVPAAPAATADHRSDHRGDRQAALRGAIASAMSRSKREIPHYYLAEPVPMQQALQWLAARNEGRPVAARLLPAVLVLKAVALALRQVPELNGHFTEGSFRPAAAAHLGVAISLRQGGLVAPALHDVAAQPLDKLMAALADLVLRCRAGRLSSSELSDATLTVSNLGDTGVDSVFGVIHPPQVALVGVGRIAERPWVVGGAVQACPMLTCTLAADHRVSDGHRGALFLAAARELLQAPAQLDTPA